MNILHTVGHIVLAVVVLVAGYGIAVLARALARRLLKKHEERLGKAVSQLVGCTIFLVVLLLAVAVALVVLGVDALVVTGLALALLAVVAFAFHESIADLAATIRFAVFRPFGRGELIETMGHLGYVQDTLAFTTVLLRRDQRVVTLANRRIHDAGIVNYTRAGRVRVDLSFTLTYGQDLDRVRAVVKEIASRDKRILSTPPLEVRTEDLNELGVRVQVGLTVRPKDYWDVGVDLRERIKTRFEAEGIWFAVPMLDVTLPAHTGATTG